MPQIKEAIANGERFWAHLRICLRHEVTPRRLRCRLQLRTQTQDLKRANGLASRLRRPAPNWNSVGLEQFVSIRGSKTRTSGEVLDDFGTFFRAHDAMKG